MISGAHENPVTYRRTGRKLRACGEILATGENGMLKVKPSRGSWSAIWITAAELDAGKEMPALAPREKKAEPVPRPRKPKKSPLPLAVQLVTRARSFQQRFRDDGLMREPCDLIGQLADELERAQTLFQR